jgi:hypothetical protein
MGISYYGRACLVWIILFMISLSVKAQETSPLIFLPGVPQASFENPAIHNKTGKLAIGIPVLSGLYANWNSNVSYNSLFTDGFNYDFNSLYNSLDDNGDVQTGARIMLFFASVKHKKTTLSFSVMERITSAGKIHRDLIKLVNDGIIGMYGTSQTLGPSSFNMWHYREVGFGISRVYSTGIDIGIRPKLLFGKYYMNTGDFNLQINTDTQNEELHVLPTGTYKMSGPLLYIEDFKANIFPGDYFFQLKNLGFAMDAGAVIRTATNAELSFAVTDIGFIGFGHNIFDMNMGRALRYSKENLYQSDKPGNGRYIEPWQAIKNISDSVSYWLEVYSAEKRAISILPVKMNVAAKYHVSETFSFGVSNQLSIYRKQPINVFSLFAHKNFREKMELAGMLSLYNIREVMPGIAASYSFRRSQIYIATNNIWGILQPASSKHLNLCFGMNFLFDTQ